MGMLEPHPVISISTNVLENEFDFRDTEIRQIVEERKKIISISQGETENNAIVWSE